MQKVCLDVQSDTCSWFLPRDTMDLKPIDYAMYTLFFGYNFGKWTPIFTVLSLWDSVGNFFFYICCRDIHLTLAVLLPYHVKSENPIYSFLWCLLESHHLGKPASMLSIPEHILTDGIIAMCCWWRVCCQIFVDILNTPLSSRMGFLHIKRERPSSCWIKRCQTSFCPLCPTVWIWSPLTMRCGGSLRACVQAPLDHGRGRTVPACRGEWETLVQQVIDNAISEWRKRLTACFAATGRHFEHSLWTLLHLFTYWLKYSELC